ncbi:MAG: DinB family protein [Phycisphaerales bacterium JB065]
MRQQILNTYAMTLDMALHLVDGVPDEHFAELPHEGAKHPGWVLGHLCVASGMGAAMIGDSEEERQTSCGVPQLWVEQTSPGSQLSTDRSLYGGKDDLISELKRVHELLAGRFSSASDDQLGAPFPIEEYRKFFPTNMDCCVYMMAHHEGYHLGQLSSWRRAMGIASTPMF